MVAIRASVHGVVQGVGFRYSTRAVAQRLGLSGWVRNLPTGSVGVWAQGTADAVFEFRQFLESGPRGAIVRSVEFEDVDPDPDLVGFEVRF